jgi:hypothetical protein
LFGGDQWEDLEEQLLGVVQAVFEAFDVAFRRAESDMSVNTFEGVVRLD